MTLTEEELEKLGGHILYHGTNSYWVAYCMKRYGRIVNQKPKCDPTTKKLLLSPEDLEDYMSVAIDIDETIPYALKSSLRYNKEGSVLIIPGTSILAERFDSYGYDGIDRPLPFLLPNEFREYKLGKIPQSIRQERDGDRLREKLEAFCVHHISRIREETIRMNPTAKFMDKIDGKYIVQYISDLNLFPRVL